MVKKKTLLFRIKTVRTSFIMKKTAVFFIFLSMAINGFVPSTIEISRYSFVMLALNITQKAAFTVLKKCNDPLVAVASKISKDVHHIFSVKSEDVNPKSGHDKEKSGEKNTSDDYAILISVKNEKKIAQNQNSENNKYLSSACIGTVSKVCTYATSPPIKSNEGGLILFFLVFVIAIRQRKGIDSIIMSKINIIGKTRISA